MAHPILGTVFSFFLHFVVPVLLVAGLVVLIAVATGRMDLLRALLKRLSKPGRSRYRARALVTANELEFFGRLVRAMPQGYVFSQVALSALIEPRSSGKRRLQDFRRISQKRVDFAVFSSDMRLVAIVDNAQSQQGRAAWRVCCQCWYPYHPLRIEK